MNFKPQVEKIVYAEAVVPYIADPIISATT